MDVARTEVRAVYAGIPAAFTVAAARRPGEDGALRVGEAAGAGMALVRIAGALAERRLDPWPTGAFAPLGEALALGSRLARHPPG